VLVKFHGPIGGTADLTIYGAMSWKSTVVGGKYFEGYFYCVLKHETLVSMHDPI